MTAVSDRSQIKVTISIKLTRRFASTSCIWTYATMGLLHCSTLHVAKEARYCCDISKNGLIVNKVISLSDQMCLDNRCMNYLTSFLMIANGMMGIPWHKAKHGRLIVFCTKYCFVSSLLKKICALPMWQACDDVNVDKLLVRLISQRVHVISKELRPFFYKTLTKHLPCQF